MTGMPPSPGEAKAPLTDEEKEVMLHIAMGQSDGNIASQMHRPSRDVGEIVASAMRKTGVVNRLGLALFFVDVVLPDYSPPGYQPGELLARWRRTAEEYRNALRHGGKLHPLVAEAVMLITHREYAAKTNAELGQLMNPVRTADRVDSYIESIVELLPHGNRIRLAVIARLAPLV